MATITHFEDLEVWRKAREFAKKIYRISSEGDFGKDFTLRNNIRESSGSIMDNIAEGFERGGKKEFIQFLGFSKGSAGETRSQLYRALDYGYLSQSMFESLKKEAEEISRMIYGFSSYLNSSSIRGSKFHEPRELYGSHDRDLGR
jgi:four helix bundle protein